MNLIYFHLTEHADENGRKKLDAELAAAAREWNDEPDDPDAPPWWWDDSANEGAYAALGSLPGVGRA